MTYIYVILHMPWALLSTLNPGTGSEQLAT